MRKISMMKRFGIITFILIATSSASANTQEQAQPNDANKTNIQVQLNELRNNVALVKRDELNYKLDRDLLKETYGSDIQQINIFITFILALFGVIGFFGLRDISNIKDQYRNELEVLQRLRFRMTRQFKAITASQAESLKKVQQLSETASGAIVKCGVFGFVKRRSCCPLIRC
ncbi:MAG TPA: hypothetical protein VND01_00015 [Candidatus Acidoferrales bacterium]|nr:hypothetical protein [Candidatus Acidoferrales bacterium]